MQNFECAYHVEQIITNFCRCNECLLPVCPSCIKLHADQHQINGTSPKFQHINKITEEVKAQYIHLDRSVKQLSQNLIRIQKNRKQNETLIKKKIIQFRNKMVKQFQRCMKEIQQDILRVMTRQGQQFISQIQDIDDRISALNKDINSSTDNLEGEQSLRSIIMFFSQSVKHKYEQQIESLQLSINQLSKKNLSAAFDQGCFQQLREILNNYIKVQTAQWKPRQYH